MVKAYLRYKPSRQSFGIIHSPECNAIFSYSGSHVLTGCGDSVSLWNCKTNTIEKKLVVPPQPPLDTFLHMVTCIEKHPQSNELIATGYSDGSIRVWNIQDESVVVCFQGHKSNITSLKFSDDGFLLVSGSNDTDVVLWDMAAQSGLFRMRGHKNAITRVSFIYPVDKMYADEETNLTKETEKETKKEKNEYLVRRQLSPMFVASASKDALLKIWDISTQICVKTILDHSCEIWDFLITPEQDRLITGGADNVLRVFSLYMDANISEGHISENTTFICEFLGAIQRPPSRRRRVSMLHVNDVRQHMQNIIISAENEKIDARSQLLLSYLRRKSQDDFELIHNNDIMRFVDGGIVVSQTHALVPPNMTSLILCCGNKKMIETYRVNSEALKLKHKKRRIKRTIEKVNKKIEKLKSTKQIHEKLNAMSSKKRNKAEVHGTSNQSAQDIQRNIEEMQESIRQLKLDSSSNYKYNINDDIAFVGAFIQNNNNKVTCIDAHVYAHNFLVCHNDNSFETKHVDVNAMMSIENANSEKSDALNSTMTPNTTADREGHRHAVTCMCVSHDDALLLTISRFEAKLWTTSTNRCVRTIAIQGEGLCAIFVAGNTHFVVGTKDGYVDAYEIGNGKLTHREEKHTDAVNGIAENPDLTGFATVSSDKTVIKWAFQMHTHINSESGTISFKCISTHEIADEGVSVKWSPNSKFIVTALLDSTCQILYSDTHKLFLTLFGHKLPINCIDISTDSTLVATGSSDKTVKLWGLDFGDIHASLHAHDLAVVCVRFIYDTHYLISAGRDGVLKLWDADTKDVITQLLGHTTPITAIATTRDCDFIFSAGTDKSIRMWERTSEQLFLEEEREKEFEIDIEKDAVREDTVSTIVSNKNLLVERASRRTIQTVRKAETVMEHLDSAMVEMQRQSDYQKAFEEWEKNGKMFGVKLPQPQLVGDAAFPHTSSPIQFVVDSLATIPPNMLLEVLVSLPFNYAEKVLDKFVTPFLESLVTAHSLMMDAHTEVECTHTKSEREKRTQQNKETKNVKKRRRNATKHTHTHTDTTQHTYIHSDSSHTHTHTGLAFSAEAPVRVALTLIQVHYRQFLSSAEHRELMVRLKRVIRPLLQLQLNEVCFNVASLKMLQHESTNTFPTFSV